MDNTSNEPDWKVDLDELTTAMEQELEKGRKRSFFENIRGFLFIPKVLPPGVDRLWVKFGVGGPSLEAEACTQDYVYDELMKVEGPGRGSLHVPKIFDYAEIEIDDFPYSLIIMEFITGTPISHIEAEIMASKDLEPQEKERRARLLKDRVVDALCFLLSLEPPEDAAPGPVGGGRIQSFVFGRDDCYAEREFDSLSELEDWVNQENEKRKVNPDCTTADLVSEGLRLCYCDPHFGNFLLDDANDPASRLTIIDFQHTSWLPYSFLVWDLWDRWTWNRCYLYMEKQVTSRSGLQLNKGNVEALHNIRLQRKFR